MKTAPCGAAHHTQQERPAGLLGKVLYWIKQPLLFLNQYCKTIKGSRDDRHTQRPAVEVEGPVGSSPWKYRVWFGSKENSWSGNNRTFQKNTAVPPRPPSCSQSVRWKEFDFLSFYGFRCLFYITLLLPVSLSLNLKLFVWLTGVYEGADLDSDFSCV